MPLLELNDFILESIIQGPIPYYVTSILESGTHIQVFINVIYRLGVAKNNIYRIITSDTYRV